MQNASLPQSPKFLLTLSCFYSFILCILFFLHRWIPRLERGGESKAAPRLWSTNSFYMQRYFPPPPPQHTLTSNVLLVYGDMEENQYSIKEILLLQWSFLAAAAIHLSLWTLTKSSSHCSPALLGVRLLEQNWLGSQKSWGFFSLLLLRCIVLYCIYLFYFFMAFVFWGMGLFIIHLPYYLCMTTMVAVVLFWQSPFRH